MSTDLNTRPEARPDLILANWQGELDGADLYRFLASKEKDPQRSSLLKEMADTEARHAKVMERGLKRLGVPIPSHRLSFKVRLLKGMARTFGPDAVYPLLQGAEISGVADYADQGEDVAALAPEERTHARTMGQLVRE